MRVPALLGVSDVTLSTIFAIAWVFVIGVTLYRYANGTRSRTQLYAILCVGLCWLAYSLLQLSSAATGAVELGIVGLAVGSFCAGIGAGIGWWRERSSEENDTVTT